MGNERKKWEILQSPNPVETSKIVGARSQLNVDHTQLLYETKIEENWKELN